MPGRGAGAAAATSTPARSASRSSISATATAIRDFPDEQIAAVIALAGDIVKRRSIPAEFVLAHSDTAPARKSDPGEKFPWEALHRAGIGHYVPPSPRRGGRFFGLGDAGQPVEAYQALLSAYGYEVRRTDGSTRRRASRRSPSSATSGRNASTASPTRRPSRRCTGSCGRCRARPSGGRRPQPMPARKGSGMATESGCRTPVSGDRRHAPRRGSRPRLRTVVCEFRLKSPTIPR